MAANEKTGEVSPGKPGRTGRYLSVADVTRLFRERALPERMNRRLAGA